MRHKDLWCLFIHLLSTLLINFFLGNSQCMGCEDQLIGPLQDCYKEVGLDGYAIAECMELVIGDDNECFTQICCVIQMFFFTSC